MLVLAAVLLAMAIMFLMVRSEERSLDRPVGTEDGGERESYVMHVAFLATGYAAIIIMLSQLPPFMTPGLGSATRWILIVAAVVISIAHVLAARDERALPPLVKYLFSGSVILAAFFFHLGFKQWSFLHFSDPFYYGKGPYVALGLILLLGARLFGLHHRAAFQEGPPVGDRCWAGFLPFRFVVECRTSRRAAGRVNEAGAPRGDVSIRVPCDVPRCGCLSAADVRTSPSTIRITPMRCLRVVAGLLILRFDLFHFALCR